MICVTAKLNLRYGGLTGLFLLNRSLVEEFRKTLCSLWQGSQTAFSPDSLFYTIWKIMPSFRSISIRFSCHHLATQSMYSYSTYIYVFCVGVISSRMLMSSCVTCWTTCTGSSSTVAMGPLTQPPPRTGSDSQLLMENAACMSWHPAYVTQMPDVCTMFSLNNFTLEMWLCLFVL